MWSADRLSQQMSDLENSDVAKCILHTPMTEGFTWLGLNKVLG